MSKKEGRVNFTIDQKLLDNAKILAAAQGISLSELICNLLATHVEKNTSVLKEFHALQKKVTL